MVFLQMDVLGLFGGVLNLLTVILFPSLSGWFSEHIDNSVCTDLCCFAFFRFIFVRSNILH